MFINFINTSLERSLLCCLHYHESPSCPMFFHMFSPHFTRISIVVPCVSPHFTRISIVVPCVFSHFTRISIVVPCVFSYFTRISMVFSSVFPFHVVVISPSHPPIPSVFVGVTRCCCAKLSSSRSSRGCWTWAAARGSAAARCGSARSVASSATRWDGWWGWISRQLGEFGGSPSTIGIFDHQQYDWIISHLHNPLG